MRQFLSIVIFIGLTSSLSFTANATNRCAELLAVQAERPELTIPVTHEGYLATVRSSEVRKQCMGSCSIHSQVAHLENVSGTKLAVDFNIAVTILDRAKEFLKSPSKIRDPENGYVDLMYGQQVQDSVVNTAKQGVLFEGEFRLSEKNKQRLRKIADALHEKDIIKSDERVTNPILIANLIFGLAFKFMAEGQGDALKPIAESLVEKLSQDIDPLRERARANYVDLFGQRPLFRMLQLRRSGRYGFMDRMFNRFEDGLNTVAGGALSRIRRDEATFDEITQFIIENLDAGRSVQLGFFSVESMINPQTGVARLDRPLDEVLQITSQRDHQWLDRGHSNLIENYRYTEDGRLVFLIKDSHGAETYDNGYIHMDAEYLHGMIAIVSAYQYAQ